MCAACTPKIMIKKKHKTMMHIITIYIQGVSKKTLFNEIGTPGGPKTIDRVGDQSKMLSNIL